MRLKLLGMVLGVGMLVGCATTPPPPVQAESGVIEIHHKRELPPMEKAYPGLMNKTGNNRGETEGRVAFAKPFDAPPEVLIGLAALDFIDGANHRVSVAVVDVDARGFSYRFVTWANTQVWYARAMWMAVSRFDRVGGTKIVIAPTFDIDPSVWSPGREGHD